MSTEVGPRGFMNNCYFPQDNSGAVLDKKGLSWHFLSWYRSCMYGLMLRVLICFGGGFLFVCFGFFVY